MTASAIQQAIPHRPPMLLLDEIVSQDERQIQCRKTYSADEFFVQGHYPGHPLVPGVILCETALQAGAVLLAQHTDGRAGIPVATRMNDVKFKQMVRPGDTVTIDVELKDQVANAFFLSGKVTCAGKIAVRLDFACALTPPLQ